MDFRVRFAPSPTGHLHIGGARTALFNFLFARQNNGRFILRIEDTDLERNTEESRKQLISSLKWLGLDWDEGPETGGEFGPYLQSKRLELHLKYGEQLVREGKAFYCFCTPDELEKERQEMIKQKKTPKYSGKCSGLTPAQVEEKIMAGLPYTIRFKVPDNEMVQFNDLVHGNTKFNTEQFGDFVIIRSNKMPTYNFAVVIDDALMKISHVLRGDDHISNTPKQILLYKALDFPVPEFGHLSMILGKDGTRLSKRHGATSVEEFRADGFLPEAMVNYLSLLGWYPKEKAGRTEEILNLGQLIEQFDISSVSSNPAKFNPHKLSWINAQHIKAISNERLTELARPYLEEEGLWNEEARKEMARIIDITKYYVSTVSEFPEYVKLFFKPFKMNNKIFAEINLSQNFELFKQIKQSFIELEEFKPETIFQSMKQISKDLQIKGKDFYMPLRLVFTGQEHGPDIVNLIFVFGKDRAISLIDNFLNYKEG